MKPFVTALIVFVTAGYIFAQKSPDVFLSRIPPLPADACALTESQRNDFIKKVSMLNDEVKKEISHRNKEARLHAKNEEENIKMNMAKQYGISEEDMKKMKKGKLTEAEKQELIQKMMKTGMNNQNNQDKNMETFKLAEEQKALTDKIMSRDSVFAVRMKELDEKDIIETSEYTSITEPLFIELRGIPDGEGTTDQDELHRKDVLRKISDEGKKYCSRMTPLYYNILNKRMDDLHLSLPDYKRLEEVISSLNQNTTGSSKGIAAPGLMELEAIEKYISLIKDAFKYYKN